MKLMIASDLHGAAGYWRARMLDAFETGSRAERLLLLGDILYHGPRNDLPRRIRAQAGAGHAERRGGIEILCVRGNCDTRGRPDGADLPDPRRLQRVPGRRPPRLCHARPRLQHLASCRPCAPGDILLHGHTHVPACEDCGDFTYLNPGSVSIPKENSPHSYMIYEDGAFSWKNLETGETYRTFSIS